MKKNLVQTSLRIPEDILEEIRVLAEKDFRQTHGMIIALIMESLQRRREDNS